MKLRLIFLLFALTSMLCAVEQEIIVYLPTRPFVAKVEMNLVRSSSGSAEYSQKLYHLLLSDFTLDGRSNITEETSIKMSDLPDYKILMKIESSSFSVVLLDPKKSMPLFEISKPLQHDWRKDHDSIHECADLLHKKMYGVEGIASTKILYALKSPQVKEWTSEIYMSDYDGGFPVSLTSDKNYSISPSLVPQQNSFIYVSYKKGVPKVFFKSLSTKLDIPLISLRGNQFLPAINKQQNLIAFISDVSGQSDLFVQSFDPSRGTFGKPRQLFTSVGCVAASPTFSPDGNKIAFVSDFERRPKIYIMDLRKPPSKQNLECITPHTKDNASPCWSPDGTKIAFSAKLQDVRQIWIYDIKSKTTEALTKDQKNKDNPTWAPNSLHIAYSTEEPDAQIYIMNLSQQKPVQITTGGGIKLFPSWGHSLNKEEL